MYPEFRLPPEQMKAFLADRQGAIAGRDTAERFGWKIGDRIPIRGDIWRPKSGTGTHGSSTWSGSTTASAAWTRPNSCSATTTSTRTGGFGQGDVGWYIVKIDDPSRSVEMASSNSTSMFANSSAETKTTTEKGFVEGFAKQIGDIGAIMMAILAAVLFTILLVVANTMAQSVRERTSELAVLKTLGFSNVTALALVLVESMSVAMLGGLLGLGVAWLIVQQGDPTNGALPTFALPTRDLWLGLVLMVLLGVLAGALPAMQAMRLRITDALRRN